MRDIIVCRHNQFLEGEPSIRRTPERLCQLCEKSLCNLPFDGTASSHPSLTDFFRARSEHIEDDSDGRLLPRQFKLTDVSFASFANCALDLDPDNSVGADYVKRLRERGRDNGKQ